MQIVHNKLVRDNIPEIIRQSGKLPVYRQLDDVSYQKALDQKLSEEVQEYLTDKNLEEMADILEVLFAICKARGYTIDELMEKKKEKAQERGGFSEKLFLEYVEDSPEEEKKHFSRKVKLSDILEGMDFANEEFQYFYNARTEEVIVYADPLVTGEDNDELEADMEEHWEDYYRLPGKYEINEYSMMQRFIESLPEGKMQERLESAICGRGAFRRFKDAVQYLGVAQQWYDYRDAAYMEIARRWCEENEIECVE